MYRIKWLLVEWENRSGIVPLYGLVNVRNVVNRNVDLHTGKVVLVADGSGSQKRAKIVMASDDRRFLEQQLLTMQEHIQQIEAAAAACQVAFTGPRIESQYPVLMSGGGIGDSKRHCSTSPSTWSNSHSDSDIENNHLCRQPPNKRQKTHKSSMPVIGSSRNPASNTAQRGQILGSKNSNMQSSTPKHPTNQKNLSFQSTPIIMSEKESVLTYDQGTQTGLRFDTGVDLIPKIEDKVSRLESIIDEFEEQLTILKATIDSFDPQNQDIYEKAKTSFNKGDNNDTVNANEVSPLKPDDFFEDPQPQSQQIPCYNEDDDVHNDMIPIGSGKTKVPKHIINQIDWTSYTMATRKLLMALFPRRTLATHSLTGKSSPAFMNKPAKLCLDPVKVNDIVMIVTKRCNVKDNLVRNAITTKCADENKMYRMRLEKYEKRQRNVDDNEINQENIPPVSKAE